MLQISREGIIQLSRGDDCEMPLFINSGKISEPIRYELEKHPETVVYVSVMEPNRYFEQGFIRKIYSKDTWTLNEFGDLVVKFTSEDTRYVPPGKYYYEIKVDLEGKGVVNTVIPSTEFWIR